MVCNLKQVSEVSVPLRVPHSKRRKAQEASKENQAQTRAKEGMVKGIIGKKENGRDGGPAGNCPLVPLCTPEMNVVPKAAAEAKGQGEVAQEAQ